VDKLQMIWTFVPFQISSGGYAGVALGNRADRRSGFNRTLVYESLVESFKEIGFEENQDYVLARPDSIGPYQTINYVTVLFSGKAEFVIAKLALS